jgi:thymidylate synthase (FAD)
MAFDYQVVKRIAYTQWAPEIELTGSANEHYKAAEDVISYCARVSNPGNQENFKTSEGLMKYCIREKHWSIFEMSNLVLEINTTRDIGRQILRHRSFHFQEFSQRYANPEKEGLGFVNREARLQDPTNRQKSLETDDKKIHGAWETLQFFTKQEATKSYQKALQLGIAKEQARALLPEGLTMSRMYMNGTCRDWFHYCQLRMGNGTQTEHQDIATKAYLELIKTYPFLKNVTVTYEDIKGE